jgi:hypothetical protein
MSSTSFSVPCECGASLSISATDAGATISCRCGRQVQVPRLSQLRISQGLDPAESNVRDTIARMIRDGALPWGQCCAVTAMPTDDSMPLDIQCERSYVQGGRSQFWGVMLMIGGFFACLPLAIFMWLIGRELFATSPEREGRDVVITIPIWVCRDSQATVRGWSQSRLREMLRTVPIYERLLREYKDATFHART